MPHLARPGGVMIHWDERGSGPLVLLAPYANSDPSVYDPALLRGHDRRLVPRRRGGRRLARRLFPDARVEAVEDGTISRPDLVAGFVRGVTSKGRATTA